MEQIFKDSSGESLNGGGGPKRFWFLNTIGDVEKGPSELEKLRLQASTFWREVTMEKKRRWERSRSVL